MSKEEIHALSNQQRAEISANIRYMDKKLEYQNIIQAFSRTNRLFGHDKAEREARITELLNSTGLAPFRPSGRCRAAITFLDA